MGGKLMNSVKSIFFLGYSSEFVGLRGKAYAYV